jgi:hypothetical protein
MKLNQYTKAIVGAVIAGLSAYMGAFLGDQVVSPAEWAGIGISFLTGLTGVWAVKNDPQTP